ncbi:TonB family protein [Thiococcus pfennigii]|uniref:TonB family protein n=1 Tax=Thiococcus pfennigii TaxID=1057 RepID=UPI00190509D1
MALLLALALHLTLLVAVSFDLPAPPPRTTAPLEVLVLREAAPRERPTRASALAQADRRGDEGQTEDTAPDAPPEDTPPEDSPPLDASDLDALPLDVELAAPGRPPPAPEQEPEPDPLAAERPASVDVAQILSSRRAEIARLHTPNAEGASAGPRPPRRKAISASTREYKYASYLEAWRRKVERIGNLNYPEIAKERKLYGNLILLVSVRADGEVMAVRVVRSSGHPELDQAAVRIVELAAPFAPFPPDIRTETDVLDITRTWQFLHGNRLDSGR